MKIYKKVNLSVYLVLALPAIFIIARLAHFPLLDASLVRPIENLQALWLLFCGLFTLATMMPLKLSKPKKEFWIWAACWWFVLFGRSISWGRDYIPDAPRLYFRILSIIWIAPLILLLLSQHLRSEIKYKVKNVPIPLAIFSVAVFCFLVSDIVEHKRMLAFIFLDGPEHQDIVEELYEVPFMIALFMTAYYYMKIDKMASKGINA